MEDLGKREEVAVPKMRPDSGGRIMPILSCVVCERLQKVAVKDTKLLLLEEPFACSKECVEKWILSQKRRSLPLGAFNIIHGKGVYGPFKSDFEKRFYYWTSHVVPSCLYEAIVFPVGKGFYIPDFYFPDKICFVEVKGKWGIGQKKKFRTFRKSYPGVSILIVPWLLQKEFYI